MSNSTGESVEVDVVDLLTQSPLDSVEYEEVAGHYVFLFPKGDKQLKVDGRIPSRLKTDKGIVLSLEDLFYWLKKPDGGEYKPGNCITRGLNFISVLDREEFEPLLVAKEKKLADLPSEFLVKKDDAPVQRGQLITKKRSAPTPEQDSAQRRQRRKEVSVPESAQRPSAAAAAASLTQPSTKFPRLEADGSVSAAEIIRCRWSPADRNSVLFARTDFSFIVADYGDLLKGEGGTETAAAVVKKSGTTAPSTAAEAVKLAREANLAKKADKTFLQKLGLQGWKPIIWVDRDVGCLTSYNLPRFLSEGKFVPHGDARRQALAEGAPVGMKRRGQEVEVTLPSGRSVTCVVRDDWRNFKQKDWSALAACIVQDEWQWKDTNHPDRKLLWPFQNDAMLFATCRGFYARRSKAVRTPAWVPETGVCVLTFDPSAPHTDSAVRTEFLENLEAFLNSKTRTSQMIDFARVNENSKQRDTELRGGDVRDKQRAREERKQAAAALSPAVAPVQSLYPNTMLTPAVGMPPPGMAAPPPGFATATPSPNFAGTPTFPPAVSAAFMQAQASAAAIANRGITPPPGMGAPSPVAPVPDSTVPPGVGMPWQGGQPNGGSGGAPWNAGAPPPGFAAANTGMPGSDWGAVREPAPTQPKAAVGDSGGGRKRDRDMQDDSPVKRVPRETPHMPNGGGGWGHRPNGDGRRESGNEWGAAGGGGGAPNGGQGGASDWGAPRGVSGASSGGQTGGSAWGSAGGGGGGASSWGKSGGSDWGAPRGVSGGASNGGQTGGGGGGGASSWGQSGGSDWGAPRGVSGGASSGGQREGSGWGATGGGGGGASSRAESGASGWGTPGGFGGGASSGGQAGGSSAGGGGGSASNRGQSGGSDWGGPRGVSGGASSGGQTGGSGWGSAGAGAGGGGGGGGASSWGQSGGSDWGAPRGGSGDTSSRGQTRDSGWGDKGGGGGSASGGGGAGSGWGSVGRSGASNAADAGSSWGASGGGGGGGGASSVGGGGSSWGGNGSSRDAGGWGARRGGGANGTSGSSPRWGSSGGAGRSSSRDFGETGEGGGHGGSGWGGTGRGGGGQSSDWGAPTSRGGSDWGAPGGGGQSSDWGAPAGGSSEKKGGGTGSGWGQMGTGGGGGSSSSSSSAAGNGWGKS